MKKLILGIVLGMVTTLMLVGFAISKTMVNCEFCGEPYSTLEVGGEDIQICNTCYGFNEGMSKALGKPITIELSNGSYTFDWLK